ncbi:hypothetical protein JTB14_035416 [Gonioctena quinquepunctata]|nr:hypothetical protein JTB14_035416 [Gonioctena quinquepunctata]
MGVNHLRETIKDQKDVYFSEDGSKYGPGEVSNILNYKSQINKELPEFVHAYYNGKNNVQKGCLDNSPHDSTALNSPWNDIDVKLNQDRKCKLPTFSNNIKSGYLENITEEQIDIDKDEVSQESIDWEGGREAVDDVQSHITNNYKIPDTKIKSEIAWEIPNSCQDVIRGLTTKKHSGSFLKNPLVQGELLQRNSVAKDLLDKYFENENKANSPSGGAKDDDNNPTNRAIELMKTISTLLRRFKHKDRAEQICIDPSDMYIFPDDTKKPIRRDSTLKFIRPFRYHQNSSETIVNLDLNAPLETLVETSICYGRDTKFVHESVDDIRTRSFENIQFLNTKVTPSGLINKILYKNDSRNLANNFSEEDLCGCSQPFLSERYLSLRNLYSYTCLESGEFKYPHHTLPKTSGLCGLRYDSGVDFRITDDEYKLWLKQNDFVKYTDYSVTTKSSSVSRKTTSEDHADASTSSSAVLDLVPLPSDDRSRKMHLNMELLESVNPQQFYQLIIYEHVAISNCINFFSCYFSTKRLKKLSIPDRIIQLLFFVMCYYVMVFLDGSGIKDIADNLTYRKVFKLK